MENLCKETVFDIVSNLSISLSNKLMVAVFQVIVKFKIPSGFLRLADKMSERFGCSVDSRQLRKSLQNLANKKLQLGKSISRDPGSFNDFILKEYRPPASSLMTGTPKQTAENTTPVTNSTENELPTNKNTTQKVAELQNQVTSLLRNRRITRQSLQRKEDSINLWKSKYFAMSRKCVGFTSLQQKVLEQKAELRRVRKAKSEIQRYHRTKKINKECLISVERVQDLLQRQKNLNEEVRWLQTELVTHQDQLSDNTGVKTLQDGKTFSPVIREACYHLQNAGVAENKVTDTLSCLYKALTGNVFIGTLPSVSTQRRLATEMKPLSRQKIAQSLEGETNLTINLGELEVASSSQTFLMSMKDMPGGTAKEYGSFIEDAVVEKKLRVPHTQPEIYNNGKLGKQNTQNQSAGTAGKEKETQQ